VRTAFSRGRLQQLIGQRSGETYKGHVAHWFSSLADAKDKIAAWLRDYNESRPHRALNNLAPLEYLAQLENGA
jgi:transposase InsO family protein